MVSVQKLLMLWRIWCCVAVTPLITGCAPSAFNMAYGAGVIVAARETESPTKSQNSRDRSIALAISRAWLDASNTRFANLDTHVDDGVVILSGSAATVDDHIEAVRIVWRQPGVAEVRCRVSFGASEADLLLADSIRVRLTGDPAVQARGYTVEVVGDKVYVLGRARSRSELNRVIRHVHSEANIRRLISMVILSQTDA